MDEVGSLMLPQEILTGICAWLNGPALQNVRLISRAWNAAATNIAEDAKLTEQVRVIEYDSPQIYSDVAKYGIEYWIQHGVARGLYLSDEAEQQFVVQFSKEQLESAYFQYCEYLFGQEAMYRLGREKEMLDEALKKLPKLQSVQYFNLNPTAGEVTETVPDLNSLDYVMRKTLSEPLDYVGHEASDQRFWTLLQVTCEAGQSNQLKDIRGRGLDPRRWNTAAWPCREYFENLPNLQNLSLEFECSDDRGNQNWLPDLNDRARLFIEKSPGQVRRYFLGPVHEFIYLPQVITPSTQLLYLQCLWLRGIVTTEAYLLNVLKRLAQSLVFLELENMTFEPAKIPHGLGQGSPIRIIQFLSNTMCLKDVKFYGGMFNSDYEGWWTHSKHHHDYFSDPEIVDPYPENCLRVRIERYITHGVNVHLLQGRQRMALMEGLTRTGFMTGIDHGDMMRKVSQDNGCCFLGDVQVDLRMTGVIQKIQS